MAANYKKAETEAAALLKKYKINTPPVDPEALAEAMGIEVVYARLKPDVSDSISGFIVPSKQKIVVNQAIHPNRKTFTIAHELAHHILHADYTISDDYRVFNRMNEYDGDKPDEEKEADAFAAHLLVPTALLKKYKDFATPTELARLFGVSNAVILNRLNWM